MKSSKPNILFTATFTSSFILNDLHSLQKKYPVIPLIGSGPNIIFKYVKNISKADVTFSWFASVYSSFLVLLAVILSKPSVIVLGGIDVAKEKGIKYGIWNSRWKSLLVRYAIKNSTRVLAVDESLKKNAVELCRYDGANIKVLPTGFDPEYWKPCGEKSNLVLTAANCPDKVRIKIKGIDFLVRIAAKAKDIQFVVVGVDENLVGDLNPPKNIKFVPFVSQTELLKEYQKSKVYFQPSYREGLPNSLCEAMLCECCPVGTDTGGIPTAIGDTGRLIKYGDVEEASIALAEAVKRGSGNAARMRISKLFLKESREMELYSLIESLIK